MLESPGPRQPLAPRPTEVQRLWLLELGLERPMLARLAPRDDQAKVPRPVAAITSDRREPDPSPAASASVRLQHDDGLRHAAALVDLLRRGGESRLAGRPAPADAPLARQRIGADASGDEWKALEARIQACEVCALHAGRQRAVGGAGAVHDVRWLVVGEAPGERDDRLGQPFQGKAGELLHAMLGAAGIDPAGSVFYTNLVKCRPRSNRLPSADEIAACLPHLHSQIALLRPRGILVLGRLAAEALLGPKDAKPAAGRAATTAFEALRGRVHAFTMPDGETVPVVVTYHPASLLSRPRHKAASWRDLSLARALLPSA